MAYNAYLHMHIQYVLDGRVVCLQNADDDDDEGK
jgi:hypothetical protein